MTLLVDPSRDQEETEESAISPELTPGEAPETRSSMRKPRPNLGPVFTRIIASAALLFVVWLIFADPIAHVWYQSRQHALRTQAANALTQLGSEVPHIGDAVGVLEDPMIGLNEVIVQGDTGSLLRGGPGHDPATPLPGAKGNSVVFGHDRDWGAPFKALSRLTVGSTLYLQAHPGVYKLPATGDFIYTVRSVSTVAASAKRFLASSNDYRLTLITDVGGRIGGSGHVLVVTAVSGTLGHVTGHLRTGSLEPPRGAIFGRTALGALLGVIVLAVGVRFLRATHRRSITVVAMVPLLAFTMLAMFLEFDLLAFRPLA
jgi:sortase (surface protein transpeptidase)